MTEDKNKGITITYNHLNLLIKVEFDAGEKIEWAYDAAGVKLYKKSTNADEPSIAVRKDYVGGIEYIEDNLEAIYHSEGRVIKNGNGNGNNDYLFEYTLKDHLGNSRVTFADLDNSGEVEQDEILQTQHYYPFGMVMEGNQVPQVNVENAYQYNGKN